MSDFRDQWHDMCILAAERIGSGENEHRLQESALSILEDMRGAVHKLMGVACTHCGGTGVRVYPSTATWHGGMGGASMTPGVCDKCWGSGRTDVSGPNLRKVESALRTAEKEASLRWFEQRIGGNLGMIREHLPTIVTKLRKARWGSNFWLHRCVDVVADTLEELAEEANEG